ncbi:MAG TPA: N-acetyl-D-Glu racemase DgcA [Azospirillaceae bacterium]|nr:N-acetyl-D-Glu racemase DgcA [Azospirillaceae bacterium]
MRRLTVKTRDWRLRKPFTIARGTAETIGVVLVAVEEDGHVGRSEAAGMDYKGETPETIAAQIERVRSYIERGATRADLGGLLPPGGARNALDCALWDLEAKRRGVPAWTLAGLERVGPINTAYTVGIDTPEAMAADAHSMASDFKVVKVKIGAVGGLEQVAAVHAAVPGARLIVDANQALDLDGLQALAPALAELGVVLIEQPLLVGQDGALAAYDGPVPLCADESCNVAADVERLATLYRYVNIKLDKSGGLTEALRIVAAARSAGMGLMVGNMNGSSLAMAPAMVVAQFCEFVDLDGPLLQAEDWIPALVYEQERILYPGRDLWG